MNSTCISELTLNKDIYTIIQYLWISPLSTINQHISQHITEVNIEGNHTCIVAVQIPFPRKYNIWENKNHHCLTDPGHTHYLKH